MTYPAEDPFRTNDRRQKLLVPKSVLEGADDGLRTQERWQKFF